MMPVILKPMEDELLYSWLLRLVEVNHCRTVEELCERFLKKRFGPEPVFISYLPKRIDIINGIQRICREYEDIICFPAAKDIIEKMTPLYALFPFMSYGYQARWVQFMLINRGEFLEQERTLSCLFDQLCVCPQCVAEDIKKYGFPYLRTWHHIPGVCICPVHGVSLKMLEQKNCTGKTMDQILSKAETMKTKGTLEIEFQISGFAKALYDEPLFFDLTGVQLILQKRLEEQGLLQEHAYLTVSAHMKRTGYAEYLNGECSSRIQLILTNSWQRMDEILAFSVFVFGDFKKFKKDAQKYCNELSDGFYKLIKGTYNLESAFGPMVKLQCRKCGGQFWIHPYAFARGCFCPECETRYSPEQIVAHRLKFLGDGNYSLAEPLDKGGGQVKILHGTCGKIRRMRLADAIWMGKRCKCECMVTERELSQKAEARGFTLVRFFRKGNGIILVLRHKNCGEEFSVTLKQFLRNPRCQYCDWRSKNEYTRESFEQEMHNLTGQEYSMEGEYQGKHHPVKIRHRLCGTVTEMLPAEFMSGKRCELCRRKYAQEEVLREVEQCTAGNYRIIGERNNYYEIEEKGGKRYKKKAEYILQELTRPTRSPLFKIRTQTPEEKMSLRCSLYLSIKETCREKKTWNCFENFKNTGFSESGVKKAMRWLLEKGYLERAGHGQYVISAKRQ